MNITNAIAEDKIRRGRGWHALGQELTWRGEMRWPHWAQWLFRQLWDGHSFYVFKMEHFDRAVSSDIKPLILG